MSNEVWVTWKDSDGKQLVARIDGLKATADVEHLRKAFVKEFKLNIIHAYVEVRETKQGEGLKASAKLSIYFVNDEGENNRPGRNDETALVLTLPSSSNATVSC